MAIDRCCFSQAVGLSSSVTDGIQKSRLPCWACCCPCHLLFPLCVVQGQLAESHVEVAKQLQAEGSFKEAEKHFVEGGDWKGAVQMYRVAGMWEGSFRLAKAHGGAVATKQVCHDCTKLRRPASATPLTQNYTSSSVDLLYTLNQDYMSAQKLHAQLAA